MGLFSGNCTEPCLVCSPTILSQIRCARQGLHKIQYDFYNQQSKQERGRWFYKPAFRISYLPMHLGHFQGSRLVTDEAIPWYPLRMIQCILLQLT